MSGSAMRRLFRVARATVAAALATTGTAWAAGGPPATKLINVVDTRALDSGPGLWVAQVYNENFVLFGAVVVVVMVVQGLVLGFGFDRAIHLLGLDLGKLSHHE